LTSPKPKSKRGIIGRSGPAGAKRDQPKTKAAIASTIGAALGGTQGSCRPPKLPRLFLAEFSKFLETPFDLVMPPGFWRNPFWGKVFCHDCESAVGRLL
jgi:hypothetical protein